MLLFYNFSGTTQTKSILLSRKRSAAARTTLTATASPRTTRSTSTTPTTTELLRNGLVFKFFNKGRWFWDHVSVLVVSLLSSRALSMILWWLDERKINTFITKEKVSLCRTTFLNKQVQAKCLFSFIVFFPNAYCTVYEPNVERKVSRKLFLL